jgi:hypothetical protein
MYRNTEIIILLQTGVTRVESCNKYDTYYIVCHIPTSLVLPSIKNKTWKQIKVYPLFLHWNPYKIHLNYWFKYNIKQSVNWCQY